tara:strand:- start:1062 stop:1466 length:405 start_codon:yes stop_codon:yes gene_type:complete
MSLNNNKKRNHPIYAKKRTLGEKASDSLTQWAGSWTFIILFLLIVAVWIYANTTLFLNYGKPAFDPFPYILLNLALSLLAAIQAPIILMSQNRQSQIDRRRAEYDYAVNRKAAREVREINIQLDRIERKLKIRK